MATVPNSAESLHAWLGRQIGRMTLRSDTGATAVEYGLMVALIAAVIIAGVLALGTQTHDAFDCTASSIQARASNC